MRYEVKPEEYKHGRKKESNWVIYDNLTNDVVARFADKKVAQSIVDKYDAAQAAAEAGEK